jgi:hypothetical protein
MNTIPLIFNEKQVRRTILGGTESLPGIKFPVCCVLLNIGGSQFRNQHLENIVQNGFESVISMGSEGDGYYIEDFVRRFPAIKFIIPHERVSIGEMINTAAAETKSDYILVLRDSLKIVPEIITEKSFPQMAGETLCLVPQLFTRSLRPVPVFFFPVIQNKRFSTGISPAVSRIDKTLFPYDYIGLYHRKKFMDLGGFDHTVNSPYWQLLDFSLRAWLWGEEIRVTSHFKINFDTELTESDTTANTAYLRFYLKNIAPVLSGDYAYIPTSTFFSYWRRCRSGLFAASRQFKQGRLWVEANKYRFHSDALSLTRRWQEGSGNDDDSR